jgi:geranylgeranyl diphosphate synthase type II
MPGAPPPSEHPPATAAHVPSAAAAPLAAIDAYLDDLTRTLAVPDNLREAVRYALLAGGKRIRPVLAWHCCAAVGGDPKLSLPAGAAVELIHAFSLVHDDLPAMDNDDFRRGRPTLHKHTSEAMAILAGDGMLTFAFEALVRQVADPVKAAALVRELAAGTTGMIAGQVYDTLGGFPADITEQDRLLLIHRNKTGALLRAACRMGAMCGGASAAALDTITAYGDAVGLMFQIVDDLLDVTSTAEATGKRTNKDIASGKLTYPGALGVQGSRAEVARLQHAAEHAVAPLGPPARPLAELAAYMAVRTS